MSVSVYVIIQYTDTREDFTRDKLMLINIPVATICHV